MMGTLVVQGLILGTLCPVVRKSDFSCSLEPPEINISGDYIDFFCSSKKSNCNIYIRSDFINIAFQWETNVNMENCYFWTFFFFK